jgi:ubiquinone/menaquinone biosynthesis C-methylase UbiE
MLPYYPSFPSQSGYCIGASDVPSRAKGIAGAPVPPEALRLGYGGGSAQRYVEGGREHVSKMAEVLAEGGFPINKAKRILEFGCAAGRMISHLPEVAPNSEYWGTDISAELIRWCRHNLTPPMNFAVTTTIPHLPFQDGFFDFLFCGSVFTHIEDLEQTWLLELGRVLSPGGRLYLTITDEHSVKGLDADVREPLAKNMSKHDIYVNNKHNFRMLVVGRSERSQVFYNSDYFRSIVPPIFRCVSYVPKAYGYQSAVALERL